MSENENTCPSIIKYGENIRALSGTLTGPEVVSFVQDIAITNNTCTNPMLLLDWWFEIVTDPEGNQWRVAWLMDTTRKQGPEDGGWVTSVWWEPVAPRHTHYDPFGPPRQVPGTLLDCTETKAHQVKDSELWADYRYNPRLERSESTGLPGHVEEDVRVAYLGLQDWNPVKRSPDTEWAITDVTADETYTYRVTITNRTAYSLDESGPVWHTEEWGLYPADGQWHGIPVNPHPGYEHLPAFCPNCGY